jgi:hypothetical protein
MSGTAHRELKKKQANMNSTDPQRPAPWVCELPFPTPNSGSFCSSSTADKSTNGVTFITYFWLTVPYRVVARPYAQQENKRETKKN